MDEFNQAIITNAMSMIWHKNKQASHWVNLPNVRATRRRRYSTAVENFAEWLLHIACQHCAGTNHRLESIAGMIKKRKNENKLLANSSLVAHAKPCYRALFSRQYTLNHLLTEAHTHPHL